MHSVHCGWDNDDSSLRDPRSLADSVRRDQREAGRRRLWHTIDSDGVIDLHGLGLKENDCITSDSPENILEAAGKLHEAITDAKAKLLLALETTVKVGYNMRQVQKSYFNAKTGKHDLLVESKRLEAAFDRRLGELGDLGMEFTK